MAKQQKMDLKDKSILYPKNLKEKHDELQHQIQVRKDKVITKQIKKRYEKRIKDFKIDEKNENTRWTR